MNEQSTLPRAIDSRKDSRWKKKCRKQRIVYSNQEKLETLDVIDKKSVSQEVICRKYNTTRHAVNSWRKKKKQLIEDVEEN